VSHPPSRFMILVSSLALEILISGHGGGPKVPSFDPSGVVGSECMPATVACPSTSKPASGSELSLFCAQPNKRLKLAGARRLRSESFFSAPQLKRDSLGGSERNVAFPPA